MDFGDSLGDAETQPVAPSGFSLGEKRLHDLSPDFFGNTEAAVCHRKKDAARICVALDFYPRGRVILNREEGIFEKGQKSLADLHRLAIQDELLRRRFQPEIDATLTVPGSTKRVRLLDNRPELDSVKWFLLTFDSKSSHRLDDFRDSLCAAENAFE